MLRTEGSAAWIWVCRQDLGDLSPTVDSEGDAILPQSMPALHLAKIGDFASLI